MSKPRYTRRKNGQMMATLSVKVDIPRDEVLALAKAAHLSEAHALDWFRDEITTHAQDGPDWHRFAQDKDSGAIEYVHVDDIGTGNEQYRELENESPSN